MLTSSNNTKPALYTVLSIAQPRISVEVNSISQRLVSISQRARFADKDSYFLNIPPKTDRRGLGPDIVNDI